jgi:hypothetical protein
MSPPNVANGAVYNIEPQMFWRWFRRQFWHPWRPFWRPFRLG